MPVLDAMTAAASKPADKPQALPMDQHDLTPLFSPRTIIVFAGGSALPDI